MRAAAVLSAGVIAVGTFLAIAAMLSVSTSWIGLGVLVIAVMVALAMMSIERPDPIGAGRRPSESVFR